MPRACQGVRRRYRRSGATPRRRRAAAGPVPTPSSRPTPHCRPRGCCRHVAGAPAAARSSRRARSSSASSVVTRRSVYRCPRVSSCARRLDANSSRVSGTVTASGRRATRHEGARPLDVGVAVLPGPALPPHAARSGGAHRVRPQGSARWVAGRRAGRCRRPAAPAGCQSMRRYRAGWPARGAAMPPP